MRHTFHIATILAVLLLIVGCRHTSQMAVLAEAETFLPAEPDSTDARLKQVDAQQLREEEELALYALLRTVTDAMQGKSSPDEGLVHEAYTFYARQSHKGNVSAASTLKHFAQAALYMGDWHVAQDSIKAAADCYRQAIKASEKCKDWHTCYISYQRLAEQVQWGNTEEALQLIEKAFGIYEKCHDNVKNLLSLYNCAASYKLQMAYFKNGTYQDALDDANREYELAKSHHLTEYENQALSMLAHIYSVLDDDDRALSYAKMIRLHESSQPAFLARKMASCYLACDSFEQAKILFHQAAISHNKKDLYICLSGLAEVAIQMGEQDSAVLYMDSAFLCSESMYMDVLQAKDDYYQETLKQEREKEQLMYTTKLKTWGFLCGFLLLCAGAAFAIRLFLLKSRMHRREKQYMQTKMQLLQEKQEAMAEILQKKEATVRYLRKYIVDRADEAAKLKEGTPLSKLSKREWKDIVNLLNEIDDKRITKIQAQHPDLEDDDINLCVLTSLRLSNPVIGQIYCITPSAVQHRKQTLKKKGFGISDPDITLDDVLESIV